MREKITFFRSYYSAIKRLPKEKQVEAYEAILDYALDGVESSEDPFICAMLELMKPNIDRSNALSDSASSRGRKGGKPKATESYEKPDEANESKKKLTKANESKKKLTKANESYEKLTKAEEEEEEEVEVEVEVEQEINNNARARADRDPGFADFWKAYPKKQGIGAAEKAWKKIKPSEQLLGAMLFAISKQKRGRQWREGYIPNPATWLNQRRWEDVVDDAPPQTFAEMVEGGLYDDAGNGQDFGHFADSIPASLGESELAGGTEDLGGAAFGL